MYYVNESTGIDLKDKFAVYEFDTTDYRLPEDDSKVDEKRILQDLQRVFVVIRNHGKPYVICKQIDYINPYNILEFIRFSTFKNRLKDRKTKGKPLIFSVYNNYSDLLLKEDITFNGNNPYYFKYFQGYYNRDILQDYNPEIIAEYLKYIKEVIANEDTELYNYLLNWVAFFVQNPWQRTRKALAITGRDWECKRIFGRILCRMIEPYSKHYVGIWNGCQMLVVFDEITLPKAKKLIIDDYVTVNEYCRPKRTVENVANLIIINDKIA